MVHLDICVCFLVQYVCVYVHMCMESQIFFMVCSGIYKFNVCFDGMILHLVRETADSLLYLIQLQCVTLTPPTPRGFWGGGSCLVLFCFLSRKDAGDKVSWLRARSAPTERGWELES